MEKTDKISLIIILSIIFIGVTFVILYPQKDVMTTLISENNNEIPLTSYNANITGNTAYINDSNAYISAKPHTLKNSGYVTFTINSKSYTGNINVLWGFNTESTKPTNAELYNPQTIEWNDTHSIDVYDVVSNNPTELECQIGNEYNNIHREVTYGLAGNQTTKIFCFDSYLNNGSDYRLFWETKQSKVKYWHDISGELGVIDYELDNKNKWYYAINVPITARQEYKVRSYIKVKPNSQGKYDFAVYPSSYGASKNALINAYNDENFYLLDPWWNSSYDIRYPHNDSGSGWEGIGYFGTNFTGWYGTLGKNASTYYNSLSGIYAVANESNELCWFNTTNNESSCPILPDANIIAYWTFDRNAGKVIDYIGKNFGTNNGATRNIAGQVNTAFDFEDTESDYVNITDSVDFADSPFTVSMWVKPETIDYPDAFIGGGVSAGNGCWAFYMDDDGDLVFGKRAGTEIRSSNATNRLKAGVWNMTTIIYKADDSVEYYIDGNLIESDSFSDTFSCSVDYIIGAGSGEHYDGIIDDVRVWDRELSSAEVKSLYHSTFDQLPFLEGTKTLNPAPIVLLKNPVNDTTTSNLSVTYSCEVSDDKAINNVTFELYANNGSILVSSTNTSQANNVIYNFTINFTSEETHQWNCKACDNQSSCAYNSSNWTITFKTYPNMTNVVNFSSAFGFPLEKDFDATDFSGIDTWWVDDTTNFSINSTGYLQNNSILQSRNYTVNISVNDTKGYTTSKIIIIEIIPDTENPRWTVIPADAYTVYNSWAGVDFDATDDVGIKSYSVNNSAFQINSFGYLSEVATNAPVGNHSLLITVNDTSNNINTTTYFVQINKSSALTASLVTNDTWTETYLTALNITYSETNTGDGDCVYTIYKNGVNVGQEDVGIFGAGTYTYLLNVTSGQNYTANSSLDTQTLTITKKTTNLSLSASSWIVGAGSVSTVTGLGCPAGLSCILERDGTVVANPDTQSFATTGNRTYRYYTNGNQNYTVDNVTEILQVIENIHFDEMLQDEENLTLNSSINVTRWFEVYLDEFTTDGYLNLSSPDSANNSWIEVGIFGDGKEWNYSGSLTTEEQTSNFASIIRTIVNNSCNCTNCTIRGSYCQIPIWFHADNGTLTYKSDIHNHGLLENNNLFDTPVSEGDYEKFVLNMSYDDTYYEIFKKELVYNGTSYSGGTETFLKTHNYNISKQIFIPAITSPLNYSYYWNITLKELATGTTYNTLTTIQNQSIQKLYIGLCGNVKNASSYLNFTIYDEATSEQINATSNAVTFQAIFYLGSHSNNLFYNFSVNNISTNVSEFDICSNTTAPKLFADATIYFTAFNYTDRNYYLDNASLTNDTSEINLYLQKEANVLEFFISVKNNLEPYANALVNIQKFFTGEGIYKTVEIDETGDDGKISSYLEVDETYKFTITKDGEVKKITTKKATCESAPCEISIYITEDIEPVVQPFFNEYASNVYYNFSYNDLTNILTFDFVDVTGTADYFKLKIFKVQYNETRKLLSTQNAYTSAGAITYNTTGINGDYLAKAYVSRSPEIFIDDYSFSEQDFARTLGLIGIFMSFLIFLIIIFGISYSPLTFIIAIPLSITSLRLLNILNLSSTAIIAVWILSIIALFSLNKT